MTQIPQDTIGYSQQPPGSLATCEYLPDGNVFIRVPPPLHRRFAQVILAAQIIGVLAGTAVLGLRAAKIAISPALAGAVLLPASVAGATLAVTLWMGFRWTIIEAGPKGLRLELRGLMWRRVRFVPRDRIHRLVKQVSLLVLDAKGQLILKIDVTTPAEERWVMGLLNCALRLPSAAW